KDKSGQIPNQIKTMDLEITESKSKISKQLADNATKISENTQAWLASKGAMKDVSEAGKGMIDSFAKINQYSVDSKELSKDYTKSQENLRDKVKEFGKAVSESYKQVSNLGGEGGQKAVELLDKIGSSMSKDVLKSGKAPEQIKLLSSAISDMASNSENFNTTDFITKLENLGFSSNDAKRYTMELGTELGNQQIKAQIASDALTSYSDDVDNMANSTYKAIDAQKELLGLKDGESEDVSSKLEYLSSLKGLNIDVFNSSADVTARINELSAKTGIASDQIRNKTTEIYEAYKAMNGKSAPEISALANMPADKLREAFPDMSQEAFNILQTMLSYAKKGVTDVNSQLIFSLKGNKEEVDKHAGELKKAIDEMTKNPTDTNTENNLFNGLQENLNQLQGQFSITTDASGKFVKSFQLLDGSKLSYFDQLNGLIEKYGDKLVVIKDKTTGALSIGFKDAENNVRTLYELSGAADATGNSLDKVQMATGFLSDNFKKLQQAPEDQGALQQWISGISTQYGYIGDHIETVIDKQGKLQFALNQKGEQNTWMVGVNQQIEALGGKLVQTGNEVDGFTYKVNLNGQEYTLFTTAGTKADEAKGKIDGAKDSSDKLHDSAGQTTEGKVTVDSSSVDTAQAKTDKLQQSDGKTVTVKAQGDTLGLNPVTETINNITKKAETPITFKTAVLPVDLDNLTQAETLVDNLQDKSGTLSRLIESIGNQTGATGNLLDTNVLGKSPLVQTLAGQLADIAKRATEASTAIDNIKSKAGSISFSVKGSFDLPDDFAKRVDEIIAQSTRMKN
ncbi:MAG: hypothetical protein L0L51_09050, partial [Lactococcus lactis]|nr:hypothetical protein [Lactococcus lactis]